jgi:hypothetical protein
VAIGLQHPPPVSPLASYPTLMISTYRGSATRAATPDALMPCVGPDPLPTALALTPCSETGLSPLTHQCPMINPARPAATLASASSSIPMPAPARSSARHPDLSPSSSMVRLNGSSFTTWVKIYDVDRIEIWHPRCSGGCTYYFVVWRH